MFPVMTRIQSTASHTRRKYWNRRSRRLKMLQRTPTLHFLPHLLMEVFEYGIDGNPIQLRECCLGLEYLHGVWLLAGLLTGTTSMRAAGMGQSKNLIYIKDLGSRKGRSSSRMEVVQLVLCGPCPM